MSALSDIAAKLDADIDTKVAENAALKAQVADLTAKNADIQTQLNAAVAELADVPAAVATLTAADAKLS